MSFPALSKLQDNSIRLCSAMRKMIRCSTFLVLPTVAILAVVAEPLVCALFGAKWLPAVPYLRIACIGGAVAPFISINNQALVARGRSDIFLKIMVVYRVLGLAVIAASLPFGVMTFYLSNVLFSTLFGIVVWAAPNRRYLGYTIAQQLNDIGSSVLLSLVAGCLSAAVLAVSAVVWQDTMRLKIYMLAPSVAVGLMAYFCLAFALRCRPLGEIALAVLPMARKKSAVGLRLIDKVGERCGAGRGGVWR